jgi:hypothetical protein
MIGVFVGFSRIFFLVILIFKGLTARRLYQSFGVKGLHRPTQFCRYKKMRKNQQLMLLPTTKKPTAHVSTYHEEANKQPMLLPTMKKPTNSPCYYLPRRNQQPMLLPTTKTIRKPLFDPYRNRIETQWGVGLVQVDVDPL